MARKQSKASAIQSEAGQSWPFGRKNYIWFGLSLLVIALGFILLSTGDITLAPVLLVAGYCILLPISILVKDESVHGEPEEAESASDD